MPVILWSKLMYVLKYTIRSKWPDRFIRPQFLRAFLNDQYARIFQILNIKWYWIFRNVHTYLYEWELWSYGCECKIHHFLTMYWDTYRKKWFFYSHITFFHVFLLIASEAQNVGSNEFQNRISVLNFYETYVRCSEDVFQISFSVVIVTEYDEHGIF